MKQIMIIVAGLLALYGATPVWAEAGTDVEAPAAAQAGAQPGAVVSQDIAGAKANPYEEYRIGPYDLLEISVFQVAEMSRAVRVNAKGTINLPLIGQVQSSGLTALQLEESIAKKLEKNYLQNPQVSVFIKEFVSQRVTVEGAVLKAGVYPLSGRTTLIQALAMASGLGPLADEKKVKIFRTRSDGGKDMALYDMDAIRAGKTADPVINGNDVIVVDESGTKATIKAVTDTLRGFIGFGTVR